jgi:hypothetical protein
MSCVQSNHSDIPRLCRARGRAPRGVVPPHVAADLGRGATPGAVRAVRVWGRRRVRRVGRIHTTINTKSIDHCTGVAWLELSLRECAPRPRTRRLPGGGAAWALPRRPPGAVVNYPRPHPRRYGLCPRHHSVLSASEVSAG